MHKFKRLATFAMCIIMAFSLTGCGEEVIPLTKEEEKIISEYAAHMVAKYNILQSEGYMFVMPDRAQQIMDEKRPPEVSEQEEAELQEEDNNGNLTESKPSESKVDNTVYYTLSQSLGLDEDGVEAVYTGIEFTDRYETVVPLAGKLLAVMHVALVNKTEEDKAINMINVLPDINATFNETDNSHAELTILENDLGTFTGTIPAGDLKETILLFQVKEKEELAVESLKLKITHDDESYDVMLVK